MKKQAALFAVLGAVLIGAAYARAPVAPTPQPAQIDGEFGIVVTAVQTTRLVDKLDHKGPYTMFVPRDAAFDALPDGYMEDMLRRENHDALITMLTHHVVPGVFTSADFGNRSEMISVEGTPLTIVHDGDLRVNGAEVVHADIHTRYGVIHVVDRLISPH